MTRTNLAPASLDELELLCSSTEPDDSSSNFKENDRRPPHKRKGNQESGLMDGNIMPLPSVINIFVNTTYSLQYQGHKGR